MYADLVYLWMLSNHRKMLSVCIPVYNRDITHLVKILHNQLENLDVAGEILVLDDGSALAYKQLNRAIESLRLVKYAELPSNVGRSRIRNTLADRAASKWLLFLDCDIEVIRQDFLLAYIRQTRDHSVICGGHIYSKTPPAPQYMLHWKAGSQREVRTLSFRTKKPYHTFMTGNFMIRRDVFKNTRFHEDLAGYGYEDTLFAYELCQAGIKVYHIDNPILHNGLETSSQFLRKTRESLRNLLHIYNMLGRDQAFADMSRALGMYCRIRSWKLSGFLNLLLRLCQGVLQKNLRGRHPSLFCLDLYKLGCLYVTEGGPSIKAHRFQANGPCPGEPAQRS